MCYIGVGGVLDMKHTALRLPERILEDLKTVARANERSVSGEIRLALRQHIKSEKTKFRRMESDALAPAATGSER